MINRQLVAPKSIVVIGASNNIHKPGGKVLKNLMTGNYKGKLYASNPKEEQVQGIKSYQSPEELPDTELAILAITAKYCVATIRFLVEKKNTRAFIILSAGFGEESEQGAKWEKEIVKIVNEANASLIGPNCIGVLNTHYNGVFTTPIPALHPQGCDFISGSGATAVFIMEAGIPKGLTFSSVYSVGNSAQIGVEEVIEYLDRNFDSEHSSRVKLLYIESIEKPQKLLKHARSLINKGCRIAAIKSGSSDAGSRAASSHTGALTSSDTAVDALLRKAGIVRCYSREELINIAGIFMHKPLTGKRFAIITHAGGPAVMLTDALSKGGLEVPPIESPELLKQLFPGSSVANPIDFLATGTAEQLGAIIDHVDQKLSHIDAMIVIFGSPGLFPVHDVYELLHQKMKSSQKPVFPVLPSVINVKKDIEEFLSKGHINFPDEVMLGKSLARVMNTPFPSPIITDTKSINQKKIREIIKNSENGYLAPQSVRQLLDAAVIERAGEGTAQTEAGAVALAQKLGFPVVMKVVGPIHKSDVNGVSLNISTEKRVKQEFNRMIKIPETTAILIQPMLKGTELFAGLKREDSFGHIVMCGMGGIFVEVLKDIQSALAPVSVDEAKNMLKNLKSYKIIQGIRGQKGINQDKFADILYRLSLLALAAPEINEMDLNPLLGNENEVVAVDARIKIDRID